MSFVCPYEPFTCLTFAKPSKYTIVRGRHQTGHNKLGCGWSVGGKLMLNALYHRVVIDRHRCGGQFEEALKERLDTIEEERSSKKKQKKKATSKVDMVDDLQPPTIDEIISSVVVGC